MWNAVTSWNNLLNTHMGKKCLQSVGALIAQIVSVFSLSFSIPCLLCHLLFQHTLGRTRKADERAWTWWQPLGFGSVWRSQWTHLYPMCAQVITFLFFALSQNPDSSGNSLEDISHLGGMPKTEASSPSPKAGNALISQASITLVSQQLQSSDHSVSSVARALNQCAAYTKKYPSPQEDPEVSSLIHRAALSQGPERQQMLSDAAAIRRTKKRLKRQRQASSLSSGLWWQTQKIASAQPVPTCMSAAPGKEAKPRTQWSTLVEKYCSRLFAGPPKESLACICLPCHSKAACSSETAGDGMAGRWQSSARQADLYSMGPQRLSFCHA